MTMPSLPPQGSTAWYTWATGVQNAASAVTDGRLTDASLSAAYVAATVMVGNGIDPTGIADCTAAVQAKVNAAGAGAVVYWPKGTYRCLVGPLSGQTFTGPGVIKRASTNGVTVAADGLSNFSLLGMTIDGGGGTSGDGTGLVYMTNATNLRVEGCRLINAPSNTPAVLVNGIGVMVARNFISGTGYGIVFGIGYGSATISDAVITGNVISGSAQDSIFVTENVGSDGTKQPLFACKRVTISGNTILNCGDSSIEVGFGSDQVTVTGNTITGANSCGVILRNARNVTVSGNAITGARDCGIRSVALNGSYVSLHNALVTNNTVTACTSNGVNSNGIRLQGDNLTISGNTASENGGTGITLETVNDFTLTGNTCSYNGLEGIALGVYNTVSASDGVVSGNICLNNACDASWHGTRDGIITYGPSGDLLIVGNLSTDTRATKWQRYGLNVFSAAGAGAVTVSGNRFSGNLTGAINDPNGDTVTA